MDFASKNMSQCCNNGPRIILTVSCNVSNSRYLATQLEYVDGSKVALHGAGIGGWISGSLLAMDSEESSPVLSCVILQSPIVDWKNYGK